MSLALSHVVFTALATNPCAAPDLVDTTPVVWTLESSVLENLPERVSVLGAPVAASLAGLEGAAFDGVDDALVFAENPLAGASSFTIEMLIAPEAGGAEAQRFLHIEDEAARRVLIELRMVTPESWALDTFIFESASNRLTLIDTSRVHPAGEWHWVALRYDGTLMAHFVDGVAEAEGTVAMQPMTPGRTSVGVRLNKVHWYRGLVREVRFHRTSLPPAALQRR